MKANVYQVKIRKILKKYFDEVDIERSVFKEARDILQRDPMRYAPRLDLVIGLYNINSGDSWRRAEEIKEGLFQFRNTHTIRFFKSLNNLHTNPNPRYAVAIEIVFSGSSKHILGDITNASTLGLYGFVVTKKYLLLKTQRILRHLQDLKGLGKIAPQMFNNVKVVSCEEFDNYFN